MSKILASPEILLALIARVPEGFILETKIAKRLATNTRRGRQIVSSLLNETKLMREHGYLYDPTRLSAQQFNQLRHWCEPEFPYIHDDGTFKDETIAERLIQRETYFTELNDPVCTSLMSRLAVNGYETREVLCLSEADEQSLQKLLSDQILKERGNIIFDPLRYSLGSILEIERLSRLDPARQEVTAYLLTKAGNTASQAELIEKLGEEKVKSVIHSGGFAVFAVKVKRAPYIMQWVCLKEADLDEARKIADEESKIKDEEWMPFLEASGEVIRPGARDGNTYRLQVLARTYTISTGAKRLGVKPETLESALDMKVVASFTDPEEIVRISAESIESALVDSDYLEQIAEYEMLNTQDVATVANVPYNVIWKRLQKANVSRTNPTWGNIRGRWELPQTLAEFRTILKERKDEARAQRKADHEENIRRRQEESEREHFRRAELRERLVAAFPTWRHDGRVEQHITLHVGQPNSGKTHDSLEALANAGSGWYLAPLRLLAFEIFDRFNQRGVLCNLLTGEEFIPIPGATITAATIEMFNPNNSGECVVIDEAQMLADADRGWAWTRALMEAQAPEIHVIGPHTVQELVEKLAASAALSMTVVEHERLAPLRVASSHWKLKDLPHSTILVAFSRRSVLELKSDLESSGRRVSVVYGNLPPEVRRNQVERFAAGENDICVATDAIGMGLNLPADNVCFFELSKFDGKGTRWLTPAEVRQIGGRAGRYGFSESGVVSTVHKDDLRKLRELYEEDPPLLTHARVAPTAEDLAMLSGHLADRLKEWAALQSIPDSLKGILKTADLEDRIMLANMLTDQELEKLGLENALKLVNAPAKIGNQMYWRACATAILGERAMPLPPFPPKQILTDIHLERTETAISCADIYLWLSNRQEFRDFAPHEPSVRVQRTEWSMRIDEALVNRLDTRPRCERCGKILPRGHRFAICDECYYNRYQSETYDYQDFS